MFIGETLPFVKTYIEALDSALRSLDPQAGLSKHRQAWVGCCLLAIIVTNSVCWKRFERASLGQWSHAQLSWLFRHTHRFWRYLFQASVLVKHPSYPTKQEIALDVLSAFRGHFPQIRIMCPLADALYGTDEFLETASLISGGKQVVSQIRKHQKIRDRGKALPVEPYFRRHPGTSFTITIRGGEAQTVLVSSARLYVCAHKTKRCVIAMKYEGEEEYRSLVAGDLSWRTLDIVQVHTCRWLVEVFIQDWATYEGWRQLAKQPDEEGSRCSVILSLLCDHCLLLHPEQLARLEHNLPACTVGSLCDVIKMESLMHCLWEVVSSEDPVKAFQQLATRAKEVLTLRDSSKHMLGRDLGRLAPTPSLIYRARVVMKVA